MQISCPQCATSYELDARLLPPGGAPVQCTRCSHVFTALPSAAAGSGSPRETQVFGTAALPEELETRDPPPARSERTQIYGKSGASAQTPAPRRTQSFGQSIPDSAPVPRGTQIFGTGRPAAPAATSAEPSPVAPIPRGTQIFGSVRPDPGGASPESGPVPSVPHGTQIFGSVRSKPGAASPEPAPVPHGTQTFGAVRPEAGAASPEPGPVAPVPHGTQIFGAVRRPEPDAASPEPGPVAPIPRGTQIFGSVRPEPAAASPEPSPVAPVPRGTQIFGTARPTGPGATAAEPSPLAPIPRGTQSFGTAPSPRSTQMFGQMSDHDAPTLMGGPLPGSDSPRATQMFGQLSNDDAPTIMGGPAMFGELSAQEQATISGEPPQDVPAEAPAAARAPDELSPPTEEGLAPARPGAPVGGRRMTGAQPRALTPFEPPAALGAPQTGDLDFDPAVAIQAGRARRRNLVLGALAVIAVGAAGLFGYQWWSSRAKTIPAEAVGAHTQAVLELRRDDATSIENAARTLGRLVKKYPDFLEARASQLVAVLFELDDTRLELDRLQQESARINADIARLKEKKAPGDWENRVNALIDRLQELKKRSDPLVDRATTLDGEVNTLFRALQERVPANPAKEEELQLVRAQAVYFGVKGADQAVQLSARYKVLGGTEGWGDLAFAEYALNTRVAPETRREAREALEALKARDASFVRLHVLVARLDLADKALEGAANALEAAVTLNPRHEVAKRLLEQLDRQRTQTARP